MAWAPPNDAIGAGRVRVIAAGLAFEVGTSVVVVIVVVVLATLAHQALVARPSLDQGAVHTEVFVRQPALVVGGLNDQGEQLDDPTHQIARSEQRPTAGGYMITRNSTSSYSSIE